MYARTAKIALFSMLVLIGAPAEARGRDHHESPPRSERAAGFWAQVQEFLSRLGDWSSHHGSPPPGAPGSSPGTVVDVPEPGTFLMVSAMGAMLAARRRRDAAPGAA